MPYQERNIWAQLLGTLPALAVYLLLAPWNRDDWIWAMVWAVVAGAGVAIVVSIGWNLAAGVRRGVDTRLDERDTHISHVSERVGQAFLVIAAITAIILCAVQATPFLIAQTLFLGFLVSAVVSAATSAVMYRVGTV